jgi:hypothetical protein
MGRIRDVNAMIRLASPSRVLVVSHVPGLDSSSSWVAEKRDGLVPLFLKIFRFLQFSMKWFWR